MTLFASLTALLAALFTASLCIGSAALTPWNSLPALFGIDTRVIISKGKSR